MARIPAASALRSLAASAVASLALSPAGAAFAQSAPAQPAGSQPDVGAADYPRRAVGLWEVRSVGAQAAGLPPARQCVGQGTDTADHHLDRSPGRRGACEFGPYRRAGAAWLAESECRQGRTLVSTRSIVTGDLESAYRIDTLVRYDPPLAGTKREDRDALEARRLGPCLAGQAPGDVFVPGMGPLNMGIGEPRRGPRP
jgi:hypothetical protein